MAIKRLLKAMNVDEERFPAREAQYFINDRKEEGMRARDVPPRTRTRAAQALRRL